MENTSPLPEGSPATIPDFSLDLDIDALLSEDAWFELPNALQQVTASSPAFFGSSIPFPHSKFHTAYGEDVPRANPEASTSSQFPHQVESQSQNFKGTIPEEDIRDFTHNSSQLRESVEAVTSNTLSIEPSHVSSLKERIVRVIGWIKEAHRDGDVLVQIWVPTKRESQQVLTTYEQPFSLNPNCQRLVHYRTISTNYQFPADENSEEILGLPGRVFVGKLPEWSPDVRYFSSQEYARVNYAQHYDIRGTLALPIFERGSRSCIAVLEVVMTIEKINYRSDIENICNALQAVDLRSSEVPTVPFFKMKFESYLAALPEITEVLRAVCQTHGLPLAQTWVPCIQQGKSGSRHSDQNYEGCISTVDQACFVNNSSLYGFLEACSEHHLLKGQGIVGQALTTTQPCFSSDISSYSKTEYPLSHHSRMFGLRAAVAIHLRCLDSGNCDFVLEFFLPVNCIDLEEQKEVLHSLSLTMREVCRTLRVVTEKELKDEAILQVRESPTLNIEEIHGPDQNQQVGNEVKMLNDHSLFEFEEIEEKKSEAELLTESKGKAAEKKRLKMEKMISLEVLQQHFSGSLKDAAKSIGVCPTTLKRICRQNGISRWPSRKIKKVDHSLKKLQVVIDSIQGVNGALQLSSLYSDFPKADTLLPGTVQTEIPAKNVSLSERLHKTLPSLSNSPSSSCSHRSSSSTSSSHQAKELEENSKEMLKRACSDAQLCQPIKESPQFIIKSQSFQSLGDNYPFQGRIIRHEGMPSLNQVAPSEDSPQQQHSNGSCNMLRVKAAHEKEMVRFRLQPNWRFRDLKHELSRRFSIDRPNLMELKYLDDDLEWVLLTCDADLQECRDIHWSSHVTTIKISVNYPVNPRTASPENQESEPANYVH